MSSNIVNSLGADAQEAKRKAYGKFLLFIAGMGGLLYGIDVGIIAGALPHLEKSSGFNMAQLSMQVAAVLLGSVLSSLFAGALSDLLGRKKVLILSAILFILSIPVICLSNGTPYFFYTMIAGRLLQGISGGLIGVVVPLYLAECLGSANRGKGTGMFQFLLTIGLVIAALIGVFVGQYVDNQIASGISEAAQKDLRTMAWQLIFWICLLPGLVFLIGVFFVEESPRWLFKYKTKEAAAKALSRSNSPERVQELLEEMQTVADSETTKDGGKDGVKHHDSLFQKKYLVPFMLAVVILACNQATGINSVLAYSVKIFQQGGLEGVIANYGDTALKIVNCLMTIVAISLVDKRGRKFLLKMGSGIIVISLLIASLLFWRIESQRSNVDLSSLINQEKQSFELDLKNPAHLKLLGLDDMDGNKQLVLNWRRDFKAELGFYDKYLASTEESKSDVYKLAIDPKDLEDKNKKNVGKIIIDAPKFDESVKAKFEKYGTPKLEILKAQVGDKPNQLTGWLIAICFMVFIAAFASGPGVCVWLALSELMPSRIRSNGMSIALLINQLVSTSIAAAFLPVVSSAGYTTMFLIWAGCSVVYFITAAFFLPETKGKTLEEIEEMFAGKKS